jgi:hypothetical protein
MARTSSSSSPALDRKNEIIAAWKARCPKDNRGYVVRVFGDFTYADVRIVDEDGQPGWDRQLQSIRFLCNLNAQSLCTAGTGFEGLEHIKAAMKKVGILDEKRGNGTTKYSAVSVEVPAAKVEEVVYQLLVNGVLVDGMTGWPAQKRMEDEAWEQARREVGA